MIERFFHIRHRNAPKGGATVRVIGGDGETVTVQVSFCSQKDSFCRKTGRDTAAGKPSTVIPLEGLPLKLSRVAHKVLRRAGIGNKYNTELWSRDFSFSTRYFEPKQTNRDTAELAGVVAL